MTELTRAVKRKTSHKDKHGHPLTVMLLPGDLIGFREHLSRKVFTLPIWKVYAMAVQIEVDSVREQKARDKQARKLAGK